jgi:hypothetical protein
MIAKLKPADSIFTKFWVWSFKVNQHECAEAFQIDHRNKFYVALNFA